MKRIILITLISIICLTGNVFATPDDSILSQHIKEADGTSGQDTNTGSGIKTGHIQDGAITTSKIADGAVTDAKITGPISGTKISSAGLDADTVDGKHASEFAPMVHAHSQSDITGLNETLAGKADINHNHDSVYQKKYAGVAVVAKSGGDYTDPVTAMNDINTWCGIPSETNPCLLKIMPGVYDIGTNSLNMKEYVDIEGSGENVTKIKGNNPLCVVGGADYSEIRFITIELTHQESAGCAIKNYNTSPLISNVTVIASGGATNYGICNYFSKALLKRVTIMVSSSETNYGIYNNTSNTVHDSVMIIVSGSKDNYGIYNQAGGIALINDARLRVFGGSFHNLGIYNSETEVIIKNSTLEISTGTYSYGIVNIRSIAKVNNVEIMSSNARYSYGIANTSASVTLTNVKSFATAPLGKYGYSLANFSLDLSLPVQVFADHSIFVGSTNSIFNNNSNVYVYVGASKLSGPVTATGSVYCAATYNEKYQVLDATCQSPQ